MKAIRLTKKEIIEKAIFKCACLRVKVDKRYTIIKDFLALGYTEEDLLNMAKTNEKRREFIYEEREYKRKHWQHAERVNFLRFLKTCKYYKEVKDEDFDPIRGYCILHRPTSNGKGWIMTASKERDNNYYTEDPILVRYYTEDPILVRFLYKKYNLPFKN